VIIGRRFAWAHLPKTGGDATYRMLTGVPGLATFADPPDSNDKHMPFFGRGTEIAGKLLVMNIRRLPAWALSAAHHQAAHGVFPDYQPQPLQTADEIVASTDPDDLLAWMTNHGATSIDRWLRAEHLEHDLLGLLDDLGELDAAARGVVTGVGRVNVGSYDRELDARFTGAQIAALYGRNPTWAAIERRVYGDLIV
jgi:hypothetical protein